MSLKMFFCTLPPLLIAAALGAQAHAEGDSNYELTISGQTLPIDLDREYTFTSPAGESLTVTLKRREVLTHEDPLFSLQYPSSLNLSASTGVEEGISQVVGISGLGNGFVLQAYASLNPTLLVDAMLEESTKQDLAYGFKIEKKPFSRALPGGQVMTGTEATLTYSSQTKTITVCVYGRRDKGLLLVTIQHADTAATDGKILDLLWASLKPRL